MRFPVYVLPLLFSFGMWVAAWPTAAQAQATASYQASNWDQAMVLPPNAYHAVKPVDLNGGFTVKTQPGTLIEGVSFQGHSGVQHWHIEGTLLRRVRIGVKLNGSGHGIDSVFEECTFNKDDGWYVDWWSTRWRFDNCIFTKTFIRGDLPPLDYSAHATRCTFYGVKLPPVGFKGNPAGYLQKGDMVFEKCRFVNCDVPQSFLAATVDCVFESCRFEPKTKTTWPKETDPIKVTAYYASSGNEVSSFMNGPLSVQFASAPRELEAGSKLVHTQSGGRVTLTNVPFSEHFVQLGTTPQKASEIVDVPVVATSASPAPTPGPAVPIPAAAPTTAEVRGLDEMLRGMPPNIEVIAGGEPYPAGIAAANLWLAKTYAGRAVAMRLPLASTQGMSDEGYAYQVTGRPQGVLYHGSTIPAGAVALFRAVNVSPLARLTPNAEFPLRGVVRKAEFIGRGHTLTFNLSVGEAQVAPPLVNLVPTPTATVAAVGQPGLAPVSAGPATAVDDPAQVVGAWIVFIRKAGIYWSQTFAADHSCVERGGHFAHWEIKDGRFLVHRDAGGTDTYELPVREGTLYGKNDDNLALALVRKGQPTPPATLALLIATWDLHNEADGGHHRILSLNADGTTTEGEQTTGPWKAFGNSLVLEYARHSDWRDVFELPGVDGTLTGTDRAGHVLKLTRQGPAAPPPVSGTPTPSSYFGDRKL